jgi:hypothetical protein
MKGALSDASYDFGLRCSSIADAYNEPGKPGLHLFPVTDARFQHLPRQPKGFVKHGNVFRVLRAGLNDRICLLANHRCLLSKQKEAQGKKLSSIEEASERDTLETNSIGQQRDVCAVRFQCNMRRGTSSGCSKP